MTERIIPPLGEEMFKGFQTVSFVMKEVNLLILDKENLGVGCLLPPCHSIVRAVGRFVSKEFEVVDGFIPMMKAQDADGSPDIKCVPMNHSWLALKSDRRFIIDVIPIGSIPLFLTPIFLYLDEYSPEYAPCSLESIILMEEVERDAEYMRQIIGKRLVLRQQQLQSAA